MWQQRSEPFGQFTLTAELGNQLLFHPNQRAVAHNQMQVIH